MLQYTFHLSSHRFPMVQHNVPNRSSVSQTQTAIVCLLMIRVSSDDMSVSFYSFFPSFSSRSLLSLFLIFSCVYVSLAASFSLICVHSICIFLSLFPLSLSRVVIWLTDRQRGLRFLSKGPRDMMDSAQLKP